ncbi:hypothetical protein D3C73_1086920 [compost metagenome]
MIIPALHCRVCPPQEVAWSVIAVEHFAGYLHQCPVRIKREARHHLQTAHRFHFPHPYRLFTVFARLQSEVDGHKGRWTMVLRPVELNTAGDPRP